MTRLQLSSIKNNFVRNKYKWSSIVAGSHAQKTISISLGRACVRTHPNHIADEPPKPAKIVFAISFAPIVQL